MKKLKFLLAAMMLPLALTSCWPEPDGGTSSPVYVGLSIYNTAVVQSTHALDPVNVAFRLNTLLSDKQAQQVESIHDVLTPADANEKKFLFGELTMIEENYMNVAGDYRITFDDDKGQSDRARRGAFIISTGNKLLTDIVDSQDAWIISTDANALPSYLIASTSESLSVEGWASYEISAQSAQDNQITYVASFSDYKCGSNLGVYKSSLMGQYSITPNVRADKLLTMAEARKAEYRFSIAISGPTFAALDGVNQTNLTYTTSSDGYWRPNCSYSNGVSYRHSGEEFVSLAGNYDKEAFPSSFVTVKFSTVTTADCSKVSATINYNGETYNLI